MDPEDTVNYIVLPSTNVLEVAHTTIDSISHSECVSLPTQLPEKEDLTQIGPTPVQNSHSSTADAEHDLYFELSKIRKCNGLKFLHYNTQSLLPKIDELRHLVQVTGFQCISINETFLDCTIFDSEIEISDMSVFRNDRNRHGGGTALFVSNYLKPKSISNITIKTESTWVHISIKGHEYIVGSLYRPPQSTVDYLEDINDDLDSISSLGKDLVLLGDFNLNCYASG